MIEQTDSLVERGCPFCLKKYIANGRNFLIKELNEKDIFNQWIDLIGN